MKRIGMCMIALPLLTQSVSLFAQMLEGPPPWFSLSISEMPTERLGSYPPGTHALVVQYTNLSNYVQLDHCAVTAGQYSITVLQDGKPLERKVMESKKPDAPSDPNKLAVQIPQTGAVPCGRINAGIKPGERVKFPLWISSEFDMTKHGRYEITVTRQVKSPIEAQQSLTINSNTLVIEVP